MAPSASTWALTTGMTDCASERVRPRLYWLRATRMSAAPLLTLAARVTPAAVATALSQAATWAELVRLKLLLALMASASLL